MPKQENAVLCAYFAHAKDPQRLTEWDKSFDPVQPLIDSVTKKGLNIVIFHDGIPLGKRKNGKSRKYVQVPPPSDYSPNVQRWFHYLDYIKSRPELEKIWMVDSTDVQALKNPFNLIEPNMLYVGSEVGMTVENSWMQKTQEPYFKAADYRAIIAQNGAKMLPNCGLVGGYRDIVIEYLEKLCEAQKTYMTTAYRSTDMAGFNYILWKYFKGRFDYGVHINTKFKGYETDNSVAAWKHK